MLSALIFIVCLKLSYVICDESEILLIDLPVNHLSQYFNNLPDFAKKVNETTNGAYKEFLSSEKYDREICWGYEMSCKKPLTAHNCPGNHTGYVATKEAQLEVFYAQADFGKLKLEVNTHTHNINSALSRLRETTTEGIDGLLRADIHHRLFS